jgi:hypothetical protein
MTNPRGPRNPKRPQYVRETGANDPEMALRFGHELRSIRAAMGPDAPSEDERVVLFQRGSRCFFAVGNAVYTWADNTAWRIHEAHGSERYEAWRHGKRIANIHPPREAHWN